MHVESFHIRRRVMPPHRGALLVAEPFLDEGCFRRAVICLAEYSEKGAVGFVLNSPTRYVLSELLEGENDIPSIPVFLWRAGRNGSFVFLARYSVIARCSGGFDGVVR